MKIVNIASEARPFCKTGGLADVVYSLAKELTIMNVEEIVILPFYSSVKDNKKFSFKKVTSIHVTMNWRNADCDVYESTSDGIKYYFIENDQYYARGHLYGDFDDGERFSFFTLACKELLIKLNLNPDVVHVHDWQAALFSTLIKTDKNIQKKYFKNTKFVLTIHNPAFQGLLPSCCLPDLYNLSEDLYFSGDLRFKDQVSTLKGGIVYSDKITTVSPTHRSELLTPEGGMGLDGILKLREFDFVGILNGIDYLEFNPENDPNIAQNYNESNFAIAKKENKKALFDRLNIKDFKGPLFSIVSRMTWQKGFDLMWDTINELASKNSNIVLLGSGEYALEQQWEALRRKYPNHIAIYIGYSDELAHQIYSASDFFIMPSLFEPCGLGQMIAQRYGALPIVRRTGGLRDSVINFDGTNETKSNGFGFDNYSKDDLRYTCNYAFDCFKNKTLFKKLCRNALNTDNSWKKSAEQYFNLYKNL